MSQVEGAPADGTRRKRSRTSKGCRCDCCQDAASALGNLAKSTVGRYVLRFWLAWLVAAAIYDSYHDVATKQSLCDSLNDKDQDPGKFCCITWHNKTSMDYCVTPRPEAYVIKVGQKETSFPCDSYYNCTNHWTIPRTFVEIPRHAINRLDILGLRDLHLMHRSGDTWFDWFLSLPGKLFYMALGASLTAGTWLFKQVAKLSAAMFKAAADEAGDGEEDGNQPGSAEGSEAPPAQQDFRRRSLAGIKRGPHRVSEPPKADMPTDETRADGCEFVAPTSI